MAKTLPCRHVVNLLLKVQNLFPLAFNLFVDTCEFVLLKTHLVGRVLPLGLIVLGLHAPQSTIAWRL